MGPSPNLLLCIGSSSLIHAGSLGAQCRPWWLCFCIRAAMICSRLHSQGHLHVSPFFIYFRSSLKHFCPHSPLFPAGMLLELALQKSLIIPRRALLCKCFAKHTHLLFLCKSISPSFLSLLTAVTPFSFWNFFSFFFFNRRYNKN